MKFPLFFWAESAGRTRGTASHWWSSCYRDGTDYPIDSFAPHSWIAQYPSYFSPVVTGVSASDARRGYWHRLRGHWLLFRGSCAAVAAGPLSRSSSMAFEKCCCHDCAIVLAYSNASRTAHATSRCTPSEARKSEWSAIRAHCRDRDRLGFARSWSWQRDSQVDSELDTLQVSSDLCLWNHSVEPLDA